MFRRFLSTCMTAMTSSFAVAKPSTSLSSTAASSVRAKLTVKASVTGRSNKTLYVDRLTADRRPQVYSLIRDAAGRADNVGVDEFPTDDDVDALIDHSDIVVCLSSTQGELEGVLVVSPCVYSRSSRPTLCSLLIVTNDQLSKHDSFSYRPLVDVAIQTARQLPQHYSAGVVDVFVTCVDRVVALRNAGFLITACIPDAGRLVGTSGYLANYIMYRDFDNYTVKDPLQFPELDRLISADDADTITNVNKPVGNFQPRMLPIPNLPLHMILSDGTRVTARPMRPDEVALFYAALKAAADGGVGYGSDELEDVDYFARHYVDNSRNVVFELTETAELVGYANYGRPSHFARSARPAIIDGGNLTIMPKFRGRKWYGELGMLSYDRSIQTETVGYQGDAAVTHLASYAAAMRMGYKINGVLPKAIHFRDKGWVDLMLFYKSMSSPLALSKL